MKLFTSKRERGRVIANLTVFIEYRAVPKLVHLSRSKQQGVDMFQWLDQDACENFEYVDSEALRKAFFGVKTPDQAEAFLKACGPFRRDGIGVTWPKFQEWQEYFKLQHRLGAAGKGWGNAPRDDAPERTWDDDAVDRIVRMPRFEPLITSTGNSLLAARAESAMECVAALNYIDRWSKVVVLSCRQCGDPFKPKTKASFCCSHACAHSHWRANGSTGARRKNVKAAK